jgi:hypothetical protein
MPQPTRADLEARLVINQHQLEDERRTQHDKFYLVAKQLALAISRRDAAKKHIKELDARLSEEVRRSDSQLKVKDVADKVLLHPEMIDASDELLEGAKQVDLWEALKEAYEQRNDALKDLIRLYLSEHFGEQQLRQAENGRAAEVLARRASIRRERRERDR